MITTRYALLAERVIRDANEDRISVVDLFEGLDAQSFPLVLPRVSFVWTITREDADPQQLQGQVRVLLDDQQLAQFALPLNFNNLTACRSILVVGGIVIPGPGNVRAIFTAEHIQDATYSFLVRPAAPRAIPATP